MKQSLIMLVLALLLSNCKSNKGFVIYGAIENIEDNSLIKLVDADRNIVIDSAFIVGGKFKFSGKVEDVISCRIRTGMEYAIIQVENTKITFNSPYEQMFFNSKIKGGQAQDLQNKLNSQWHPLLQKTYVLQDSFVNKKYRDNEERNRLLSRLRASQSDSQEIYVNFGKKQFNTILGLEILYMNRQNIPKDTLNYFFSNLDETLVSTPAGKGLSVYLNSKTIEIGEPSIDFKAKTLEGNDFQLSSLKGKYVYLSFWSYGCAPCRMENKFLSTHFDEIPDYLSFVSFSLDSNMKYWKMGSKVDGVTWVNVSNLQGNKGEVKTKYNVQAIPTSFLIDKEGVVLKKFTGYDPDRKLIEDLKGIIGEYEM